VPKERYRLISGPFGALFGISTSLVGSALACAIPNTPPVASAVSPGMRADGGSAAARRPGQGPALVHREGHGRPPICSTRPQNRQIANFWNASATARTNVPRGRMCRFFLWRRWLYRPCGGLDAKNRASARRMARLGADLAGGPFGQVPRPNPLPKIPPSAAHIPSWDHHHNS
jgi:hypothetical protein